jgi:hypothetical protein
MSKHQNNFDKEGFCKLGSELVISYTGTIEECIPEKKSSVVGTILTRFGELVSRDSPCDEWVTILTPSVYLFFDIVTNHVFLVNTCRKKIEEIKYTGRTLNCSDRIIYEVKCNKRTSVCNLANKQYKTIVLCQSVPENATSVCFQFPGSDPVVSCFSQISPCDVVFQCNTAIVRFPLCGPGSIYSNECVVLLFDVCIDGNLYTIAKIFNRESRGSVRFSSQAGKISTNTLPNSIGTSLGDCLITPTLAPGSTALAYPIVNWEQIYTHPELFNSTTGLATILKSADYSINAKLNYCSGNPIPNFNAIVNFDGVNTTAVLTLRDQVPYFALVKNGGTIVNVAPITANLVPATPSALGLPATTIGLTENQAAYILTNLGVLAPIGSTALATLQAIIDAFYSLPIGSSVYDLTEIGEAIFNINLPLIAGNNLQVVFVDPLATFTGNPGSGVALPTTLYYELIPLGTTFNMTQIL